MGKDLNSGYALNDASHSGFVPQEDLPKFRQLDAENKQRNGKVAICKMCGTECWVSKLMPTKHYVCRGCSYEHHPQTIDKPTVESSAAQRIA